MSIQLSQIRVSLEDGLLSFPITDMDDHGNFHPDTYAQRIAWFLQHGVSSVFVAGGTGEFFSLSMEEYTQIVKTACEVVKDNAPVISSVGRSIPEAIQFAKIAEKAGIHALLLMPPYLTECPPEGTYAYAKTIMDRTSLPVIYYNRSNGVLNAEYIKKLADQCPNFIGLKDGTGNMADLNDTIKTVGNRLSYIGGVPTAEIIAEAYLSIGVNTYSSAAFNFVPELANLFYKSLRQGDKATINLILNTFYIPLVRLRSKKSGYAVSLIKAGATIIGRSAGAVRAPLVMPSEQEVAALKLIIENGNALVS
ncbi:MAG: 5-dehydro-4-deoxyglucarate dehydratase [Saprospiraceae bacterium]|jgi:5-dehydro-4-deoxyglucarate dehydratase|nr:5-dehydro-4-deoxyglucarate dehydratase [Saprospiraceae bacterium]MBK6814268.1 5-dehydro-4-deoxyglucarate dehydratase [Saprospiraceae bacterium]MBK7373694.1 5-dehydro-4-deoxyglucarate dehydratase [Saprospiraceae bacterium]MBK7437382.1 5-dehydro-4-deoxyglucarate dehydratase [Saprospiraceae bacterium]MBK8278703.1 5-dehydro-4-deoxyglucarate dehydratase [Saprospiraceae bacterium]